MSYQPGTPQLCTNGCGFFGTSVTHNLCSKCYRDFLKEQLSNSASKLSCLKEPTNPTKSIFPWVNTTTTIVGSSTKKNRCQCCKKKVGLAGFDCRCGAMFCGIHRYPEEHSCTYDFKNTGRVVLAKENPVCNGEKLHTRI